MKAEPDAEHAADNGGTKANGTPVTPPGLPVTPAVPLAPGAAGSEASRSRRFPPVTRDTARPEGSGRAVPGAVSTSARQWPMLSVLTATAVGLLVTALGQPRVGCLIIGVALIAASVLRRVLPSVGMLAVRSRFTDMITYGLLGVAITLLALVMEPGPWLEIPFMESAVRFTVR
ncbi:DUF3017 domain-containing protein [Streptomyces sp. NBC_01294]|uniref:DUF3017 domain-containing protein n=1 Tax=Streptomyces sp. NBC_01294 TaxID=2903815 RepID=UPI002DD8F916|nr:DUF3017 domain-containing protein [Streptomyces sp. NBC_01294]WRZ57522.1 DUF3017 domain-containing protein [Streptomyces sp. NBC_01294]